MGFIFPAQDQPVVEIAGGGDRFPVHRIYCVGQNYARHVAEMGGDVKLSSPVFFSKPADAVVPGGGAIKYPTATSNLHHEVELVVGLAKGGIDIEASRALNHVFGYAVGVDLTRRDLQGLAKKGGKPWDTAKGFDNSAPIGALVPVGECGHRASGKIQLSVNGQRRQEGQLQDMIWPVAEIISALSALFELKPGDLIFTGTPEGVGALKRGDNIEAAIEGLAGLSFSII
jgi:fumarylpyruvate hydrolase